MNENMALNETIENSDIDYEVPWEVVPDMGGRIEAEETGLFMGETSESDGRLSVDDVLARPVRKPRALAGTDTGREGLGGWYNGYFGLLSVHVTSSGLVSRAGGFSDLLDGEGWGFGVEGARLTVMGVLSFDDFGREDFEVLRVILRLEIIINSKKGPKPFSLMKCNKIFYSCLTIIAIRHVAYWIGSISGKQWRYIPRGNEAYLVRINIQEFPRKGRAWALLWFKKYR